MNADDQRTGAAFPQYTATGSLPRGAGGYNNNTLTKKGTLPRNGKGTLPRNATLPRQHIVSDYTPSYEPNPNTLEKKKSDKKGSSKASSPTFIDDVDDEFDYLKY